MGQLSGNSLEREHAKSWDVFLAKNFKPFITYVIKSEVHSLGLKVAEIAPHRAKRNKPATLEIDGVLRRLLVDFGEVLIIPDVDMAFYRPKRLDVLAVCFLRPVSKTSAIDAAYWKIMLAESEITRHIKVFFITLRTSSYVNMEATLAAQRALAVLANEVDNVYIVSEDPVKETAKIKSFDKFVDDLKDLVGV